jgi:hypothetical protein
MLEPQVPDLITASVVEFDFSHLNVPPLMLLISDIPEPEIVCHV